MPSIFIFRHHFLRQCLRRDELVLTHCPTGEMLANGLYQTSSGPTVCRPFTFSLPLRPSRHVLWLRGSVEGHHPSLWIRVPGCWSDHSYHVEARFGQAPMDPFPRSLGSMKASPGTYKIKGFMPGRRTKKFSFLPHFILFSDHGFLITLTVFTRLLI